jgi:hypothetical protein
MSDDPDKTAPQDAADQHAPAAVYRASPMVKDVERELNAAKTSA